MLEFKFFFHLTNALPPGQRKVMMVNITCTTQNTLSEILSNNHSQERKLYQIAQLKYSSKLSKMGINPENIDLSSTKVMVLERPEDKVFGGICPLRHPYEHGYTGICPEIFPKSSENIVEGTITTLLPSFDKLKNNF